MEPEFWHDKWRKEEIGFHQTQVNSLLATYISSIIPNNNSRIFVPLCGKTLDIDYLLSQGYDVVAVELSEPAVEQLFNDLAIKPAIINMGKIKRYSNDRLEVFVGDIFDLSQKMLGSIDLIYDRAALVALPFGMRKEYTAQLIHLSQRAPQLLVCFEYDQALMKGPPFSISHRELDLHYQNDYRTRLLASEPMSEKIKGKVSAQESILHLK